MTAESGNQRRATPQYRSAKIFKKQLKPLPAANYAKDKYGYDEWHFIEISNDIRDIQAQLEAKIRSL